MTTEVETITLDAIAEIVVQADYEIVSADSDRGVLTVRDLDTGLMLALALRDNVLFNTVPLITVKASAITADIQAIMLDADNGISTSGFQLYKSGDDVSVTLNNFAKLQELGADDQDDILSCLEFLVVDAWAARELLSGLVT